MYSIINFATIAFYLFPDLSCSNDRMVSLANLHMRPEVLARYYVRSHWHTGYVKKRSWKTIESSVPPANAK